MQATVSESLNTGVVLVRITDTRAGPGRGSPPRDNEPTRKGRLARKEAETLKNMLEKRTLTVCGQITISRQPIHAGIEAIAIQPKLVYASCTG